MSLKKIARFPEGPSTLTPGLRPWRFSGKASVASAPPRKSVCVCTWQCHGVGLRLQSTGDDEARRSSGRRLRSGSGAARDLDGLLLGAASATRWSPRGPSFKSIRSAGHLGGLCLPR